MVNSCFILSFIILKLGHELANQATPFKSIHTVQDACKSDRSGSPLNFGQNIQLPLTASSQCLCNNARLSRRDFDQTKERVFSG